jgi:hypothetical protein
MGERAGAPSKYRDAAERCRRRATTAPDPSEWLQYCRAWNAMARQAEALADPSLSRAAQAQPIPCAVGDRFGYLRFASASKAATWRAQTRAAPRRHGPPAHRDG